MPGSVALCVPTESRCHSTPFSSKTPYGSGVCGKRGFEPSIPSMMSVSSTAAAAMMTGSISGETSVKPSMELRRGRGRRDGSV